MRKCVCVGMSVIVCDLVIATTHGPHNFCCLSDNSAEVGVAFRLGLGG